MIAHPEAVATDADAISTDRSGWRVRRDGGHGFQIGFLQINRWFYPASLPGRLEWLDRTYPLSKARTTLSLPVPEPG